jgi:hypothetical protein
MATASNLKRRSVAALVSLGFVATALGGPVGAAQAHGHAAKRHGGFTIHAGRKVG